MHQQEPRPEPQPEQERQQEPREQQRQHDQQQPGGSGPPTDAREAAAPARPRRDDTHGGQRRAWRRERELAALGRAVRELRARHGYSQEALGERAGLHRNYVGAIERGEINPTFRVLVQLAAGLGEQLSELLTVYERHVVELPGWSASEALISG